MTRVSVEIDDLFCVAAIEGQTDGQPHELVRIGTSVLCVGSDRWIVSPHGHTYSLDAMRRRLKANVVRPATEDVFLASLAKGLSGAPLKAAPGNAEERRRHALNYLTVLFAALKNRIAEKLAREVSSLVIAVPAIAAMHHPLAKGGVNFTDGFAVNNTTVLQDCTRLSLDNRNVVDDFVLAARAAGFINVTAQWAAEGAARAASQDSSVLSVKGLEHYSTVVIEFGLEGLVIVPFSLQDPERKGRLTPKADRPVVFIPFNLKRWLNDQIKTLGDEGENAYGGERLLDWQRDQLVEMIVFGKDVRDFSEVGFLNAQQMKFEETRLCQGFAMAILQTICNAALVEGAFDGTRSAYKSADAYEAILSAFDQSDAKNRMSLRSFRLTGSLGSHPFFRSLVTLAAKMIIWEPAASINIIIPNEQALDWRFGGSALRALKDQERPAACSKSFWTRLDATLAGAGATAALPVHLELAGGVTERPVIGRLLEPEILRQTYAANSGNAVCTVMPVPSDSTPGRARAINIALDSRHRDAAVEVEIKVDRLDRIDVAVLLDGKPFPATLTERDLFDEPPPSPPIRADAQEVAAKPPPAWFRTEPSIGRFRLFASDDHKTYCELVTYLNGAAGATWSFHPGGGV